MTDALAVRTQRLTTACFDLRICLTRSQRGVHARINPYSVITPPFIRPNCSRVRLERLLHTSIPRQSCQTDHLRRKRSVLPVPEGLKPREVDFCSKQNKGTQASTGSGDKRGEVMQGHLQFVTTPTADTPGTALTLSFLDRRYFFGHMHEGLQRAGLQHGAKFAKIRDFFVSGRTEWTSTGGLLGLILSVADTVKGTTAAKNESNQQKVARAKQREQEEEAQMRNGKSKGKEKKLKKPMTIESKVEDPTLRIRSGRNLRHTLAAARSFIFRQGMPIEVEEFDFEQSQPSGRARPPVFEDDRIKVWALCVKSQSEPMSKASPRVSPGRKRSHDDYIEGQHGKAAKPHPSPNQQEQTRSPEDTRKFLVKEMFQSQWSYNKLIEVPLHEVTLPATLFVRDPNSGNLVSYKGPLPNNHPSAPNIPVLVREPWPGAIVKDLPPTTRSDVAVSYIINGHEQRGKFRPEEAKRLGVPAGPLFRQLANGDSVTIGDGITVTPEMVLEPSRNGGGFAILDIPSRDFLKGTISQLEDLSREILQDVKTMVWLLGPNVSADPWFTNFVGQGNNLTHVISSPDICSNTFAMTSAAGQSARHHNIDPVRFPFLKGAPDPVEGQQGAGVPENCLRARHGLKFQVIPDNIFATQNTYIPFDQSKALEDLPPEVINTGQQVSKCIKSDQVLSDVARQNLPSPEAEITFLGTGSMLPSLYRNVSATLLRVPKHGSYLLDCGENTLGQLRRLHSKEELQDIFEDLKLIWISHLHADHHLGTVSVIRAWYEAVHKKQNSRNAGASAVPESDIVKKLLSGRHLFVVSNPLMARFLKEYSSVEDFGYEHVIPLSTSEMHTKNSSNFPLDWNGLEVGLHRAKSPEIRFAMREATGLSNLAYCRVAHCWGANAVSLTFASGFKFSYSGDCRPSERFASIGRDSTLLLHEATFDDEHMDDAKAKRHSTISEAIGVGAAMRAKRVLLTHFSQRFAKIPTIDDIDRSALSLEGAEDVPESEADQTDGPVDIPPDETSQNLHSRSRDNQDLSSAAEKPVASVHRGPASSKAASMNDMKIGIAFDHMRVKVKDIMLLEKFNPVLRELYATKEDASEV